MDIITGYSLILEITLVIGYALVISTFVQIQSKISLETNESFGLLYFGIAAILALAYQVLIVLSIMLTGNEAVNILMIVGKAAGLFGSIIVLVGVVKLKRFIAGFGLS